METETRPRGIRNPWLHLIISVACVAIYELLLKRGATETADPNSSWSWTGLTGLGSIYVWIAIVFVIVSLITWLYVLRYLPLSVAFPISQSVHVLVPLGSWLILGETITPRTMLAAAVIVGGVMLIRQGSGVRDQESGALTPDP